MVVPSIWHRWREWDLLSDVPGSCDFSAGKDSGDHLGLLIAPSPLVSNSIPFLIHAVISYYMAIHSPWKFQGFLEVSLKGCGAHLLSRLFLTPLLALWLARATWAWSQLCCGAGAGRRECELKRTGRPWQPSGASADWTLAINRKNTKLNVFLIYTWYSFI